MELKDKILEILEKNRGKAVSGGSLAKELGVSRNAVWKCVSALRSEGFDIFAATNRGYVLSEGSNSLSAEGIRAVLGESRFKISTVKTVDSTNTALKAAAQKGAAEYTVLAAEEQTAGKGRMGRRFESPSGTGIYMSVILRPKMKAEDSLFITASAAVAVARAIETLCKKPDCAKIKWVNDVFIGDKKVCGILTEAALDFESGRLDYAVLGIGVNISPSEILEERLGKIAGSVLEKDVPNSRNILAAEILRELSRLLDSPLSEETLEEYRRRSYLDGKSVTVFRGNESFRAKVLGIDERARLLVKTEDGEIKRVSSGEVSVKAD